jgi:hypothetical protein
MTLPGLRQRHELQAAEAAILKRLQALSLSSDQRWEKEAIENALGALAVLKRGWLRLGAECRNLARGRVEGSS